MERMKGKDGVEETPLMLETLVDLHIKKKKTWCVEGKNGFMCFNET